MSSAGWVLESRWTSDVGAQLVPEQIVERVYRAGARVVEVVTALRMDGSVLHRVPW
jgi:hypothetical protein